VGNAIDVDVPIGTLFSQLVLFLEIPIGLGMIVRSRRPEASTR